MENDLTLIYYTDNTIDESVAQKIRAYILEVTEDKYPVVSVSQQPITFGENICLGPIGKSKYNLWKQVWLAAKAAKTKYVACIEDDTLYSPDHFWYCPPDDVIAYESNYWFAQPGGKDYYWQVSDKKRIGGQFGCISNRQLLVDNLSKRYEMYPTDPYLDPSYYNLPHKQRVHFGEPARGYDAQFGITNSQSILFASQNPCVVFIHPASLGYRGQSVNYFKKYGEPKDKTNWLPQFGTPEDIFQRFWKRI